MKNFAMIIVALTLIFGSAFAGDCNHDDCDGIDPCEDCTCEETVEDCTGNCCDCEAEECDEECVCDCEDCDHTAVVAEDEEACHGGSCNGGGC